MKKIFFVYGALVIIVIALIVWRVSAFSFDLPFFSQKTAVINGSEIKLMVADDEKSRMKGLSDRRSLNENTGMLFVFEEKGSYGFWMKNMNFPLDIIYLDGNKVIDIKKNVQPADKNNATPEVYTPKAPVDKVLEVVAGVSDSLKITEGSEITFENL
jgi:uncharacterized membrane protein (UPF0127 family)